MTRRRRFTDEECRALASWFTQLRAMGSVRGKCRELGVSKGALMDAIARGSNAPTRATREKLTLADIDALASELTVATSSQLDPDDFDVVEVPHETGHSGQNGGGGR